MLIIELNENEKAAIRRRFDEVNTMVSHIAELRGHYGKVAKLLPDGSIQVSEQGEISEPPKQ